MRVDVLVWRGAKRTPDGRHDAVLSPRLILPLACCASSRSSISHYCEKARWALERAGLAYREERHVQAIHWIAARRAGGGRTVPVLVTPEGALGESEEILVWADERTSPEHRLFPADPGERAEVNECAGASMSGSGRVADD